jgi:hypothetical protein
MEIGYFIMHNLNKVFTSLVGLSLFVSTMLAGDVVTSNFGNNYNNRWLTGTDVAVSVTTGEDASSWSIVQLRTYGDSTVMNSNDYTVSFWSDNGGSPGSRISGTELVFDSAIAAPDFYSDAYLATYTSSGFILENNTTYWLVFDVTGTTADAIRLFDTDNTSEDGWALGNYTAYGFGAFLQTWSSVLSVELTGVQSSVPEPSSAALVFAAAAGGWVLFRRNRRLS